MVDLTQLYDDVMMDHIKNARNYREISGATQTVEAFNVLCGDKLTLYVSVDADERIHVGEICLRVELDERCVAVAGSLH